MKKSKNRGTSSKKKENKENVEKEETSESPNQEELSHEDLDVQNNLEEMVEEKKSKNDKSFKFEVKFPGFGIDKIRNPRDCETVSLEKIKFYIALGDVAFLAERYALQDYTNRKRSLIEKEECESRGEVFDLSKIPLKGTKSVLRGEEIPSFIDSQIPRSISDFFTEKAVLTHSFRKFTKSYNSDVAKAKNGKMLGKGGQQPKSQIGYVCSRFRFFRKVVPSWVTEEGEIVERKVKKTRKLDGICLQIAGKIVPSTDAKEPKTFDKVLVPWFGQLPCEEFSFEKIRASIDLSNNSFCCSRNERCEIRRLSLATHTSPSTPLYLDMRSASRFFLPTSNSLITYLNKGRLSLSTRDSLDFSSSLEVRTLKKQLVLGSKERSDSSLLKSARILSLAFLCLLFSTSSFFLGIVQFFLFVRQFNFSVSVPSSSNLTHQKPLST